MKVIAKPKPITVYDAIMVEDHIGKVLVNTKEVHQEIIQEEEQIWLVEKSETDETVNGTQLIGKVEQKISLNIEDMLIKVDKGYTKPIAQFIEMDKPLERAVNKINKINNVIEKKPKQ